ncbi:MAG: hypothetical protein ACX93P_07220 [Roseovarius sp.]
MRQTDALIASIFIASGAAAQEPLSAIEWLDAPVSVTVAAPRVMPLDDMSVSDGVDTPQVAVMPLGSARSDSVGLLPSDVTGLPVSLWQASTERAVTAKFARLSPEPLPAIQALYYTLLLAEAEAPADAGAGADFLKVRLTALESFGAVDPALALIERAGPATPALFDRWLDLSLLAGTENAACKALADTPALSQRYDARIFCMARSGDWQTAALIYETALALDLLSATEADLLAQFLDPEMVGESHALAPPSDMTPLLFRLYEAIGEPLPTQGLPRAFAMADLRPSSGWKARIEAAERLTRTGALPPNRLLGLYTERSPAASGGVWDRVAAIQAFDQALSRGRRDAIADTLPDVWRKMREQRLSVSFAELYGKDLAAISGLPAPARGLALRIALLSPDYETAAQGANPDDLAEAFLAGLARGAPPADLADTPLKEAIARAFEASGPARAHAGMLDSGKLGQAILTAALQLDEAGPRGFDDISKSLATLRAVGLEDTARRAGLQLLILERGA